VFQSVDVKYPSALVVAAGIDIVLVALLSGLLKVSAFSFELNAVRSVALKYPSVEFVASGIDNVRSELNAPPPASGAVVDTNRVVGTPPVELIHFKPVAVVLSAESTYPFVPTGSLVSAVPNVKRSPLVVRGEVPDIVQDLSAVKS
jgi:hypothetical protein